MADPYVIDQIAAPIPNGTAITGEIDLGGKTLVGIVIPSAWATAGISFQSTIDGVNFGELLDQTATAIGVTSVTGAALTFIAIDPTKFRGFNRLKVRSGTSAAPVNQTGVTLTLLIRFVS